MVLVRSSRRAIVSVGTRAVFGPLDWLLWLGCSVAIAGAVLLAAGAVAPNLDPASVVVLLPALVALAGFGARWASLPLMRAPVPVDPAPDLRIGVATTFVPGLEPIAMLRRTVEALVAMEIPHDTWVLDEGDDDDVRALCDELGARHFSRRSMPRYQQPSGSYEARTKHGNYNAWLDAVGFEAYDVVVGFDPDHMPLPSFLSRTLGYLRDDGVGYVQAPQLYYNQAASFVAQGAAEETYAYYSSIQMAAFALGYPIVTGCHNVHRSVALREVGGFAAHEADDLLVTVRYRAAGWRGVYVPEALAAGVTPVDWPGYLLQQRRWARSVLDVKLRVFPRVAGRLPVVERVVSAVHGLHYLYAFGTAAGVVSVAIALATGWAPAIAGRLGSIAVVPAVLFGTNLLRQRWYLDRRRERGVHVRAAGLRFAKWPFVLLALGDAVRGGTRGYATTPKVRRPQTRPLRRAHGPVVALLLGAAAVGLVRGHVPGGAVALASVGLLGMSVLVIALEQVVPPPDPYDDALAVRWQQRTREIARQS